MPTANVAFSAIAPSVVTVASLTVPVASVAFTAHAPTASPGAVALATPTASIALTAIAPTVTVTAGTNVLAAQVLNIELGESAPDVGGSPSILEIQVFD